MRRRLCLLGCVGLSILTAAIAIAASGSSRQRDPVRFDLGEGVHGVLLPGQTVDLSVQVTGSFARQDDVAVIVQGPSVRRRLLPLRPETEGGALSTAVRITVSSPGPHQVLPLEVSIVRLRGMSLVPLFRRTVYLTVGRLPVVDAKTSDMIGERPADAEAAKPGGIHRGEGVAPEPIREEPLLPVSAVGQSPVYWKQLERRIRQSWRDQLARAKSRGKRRVTVAFRLYANGEAQLIQVERSSGDDRLDAAGLDAVLDVHPFPPLPAGSPDPHVDVHIELQESAR